MKIGPLRAILDDYDVSIHHRFSVAVKHQGNWFFRSYTWRYTCGIRRVKRKSRNARRVEQSLRGILRISSALRTIAKSLSQRERAEYNTGCPTLRRRLPSRRHVRTMKFSRSVAGISVIFCWKIRGARSSEYCDVVQTWRTTWNRGLPKHD